MSLFEINTERLIEEMNGLGCLPKWQNELYNVVFDDNKHWEHTDPISHNYFPFYDYEALEATYQFEPPKTCHYSIIDEKLEDIKPLQLEVKEDEAKQQENDQKCEEEIESKHHDEKSSTQDPHEGISTNSENTDQRKASVGRKRQNKNATYGQIYAMLKALIDQLNNKVKNIISKNARSDSVNTTIIRKLQKITKKILGKFATKNQLKSSKTSQYYADYLKSFNNGFVPLFVDKDIYTEEDIQVLFKDYIKLSFPPNKVIAIHCEIFQENLDKQVFLAQSRDSSKTGVKAMNNGAFYLICNKLLEMHENNEITIHERILPVLNYFMDYD